MKGLWQRTKARLQKKLGPLPVWVWVAGVLLLAILYVRHKNASASTATTTATDTTAAAGTPADLSTSSDGGGGSGDTTAATPLNPLSTPASWDPSTPTASTPPKTPPSSPGSQTSTGPRPGSTSPFIQHAETLRAAGPQPGSTSPFIQHLQQTLPARSPNPAPSAPAASTRPPVIVVPTNTLGGHTLAKDMSKGPRSKVGI